MSLSELRADIARNQAALAAKVTTGEIPAPVAEYFSGTVWPWLEALLEESEEQADAIDELIEQTDDFLTAETAAKFSTLMVLGTALAQELKKRIDAEPNSDEKSKIMAQLFQYAKGFKECCSIIEDITVEIEYEDEEGEEDDDDGDEGDDESEEG